MHPYGWMSGSYCVQVPDPVNGGGDREGCLMLGLSDALVALFPSHSYHQTFPQRAAGKRICVVFDITPDQRA